MFTETSLAQPSVLLTVVCETTLKDNMLKLYKNLKVRGYTITSLAAAEDCYGTTMGSDVEHSIIEIKALVSKEISDVVMHTLRLHRGDNPVIVYRHDVETMLG